jgi:hypothetical protein
VFGLRQHIKSRGRDAKGLFAIFSLCLFLFPAAILLADGQITIVEKEGEAVLGEDTTPAQARARALNNARRVSIEEVCGGQVQGNTVVYKSKTISDLVTYASRGVIVKEESLFDAPETRLGVIVYRVKIRAWVKSIERVDTSVLQIYRESAGRVGAETEGDGLTFYDHDEIRARAWVSDECFISLFCVDRDGMVTVLYPNEYIEAAPLPKGTEFVFPTDRQREMGLKVRVRGPKKKGKTEESLLIVATKDMIPLLRDKQNECTITDLMKELSEIPTPWAVKVLGYEIQK